MQKTKEAAINAFHKVLLGAVAFLCCEAIEIIATSGKGVASAIGLH